MRKALFLLSGLVYWPLLLVGCFFWGLTAVFMGSGEWIHDVMMPPYKAPPRDPLPENRICSCGAEHTGPCLPGAIS